MAKRSVVFIAALSCSLAAAQGAAVAGETDASLQLAASASRLISSASPGGPAVSCGSPGLSNQESRACYEGALAPSPPVRKEARREWYCRGAVGWGSSVISIAGGLVGADPLCPSRNGSS